LARGERAYPEPIATTNQAMTLASSKTGGYSWFKVICEDYELPPEYTERTLALLRQELPAGEHKARRERLRQEDDASRPHSCRCEFGRNK